jgi:hypothetical protein
MGQRASAAASGLAAPNSGAGRYLTVFACEDGLGTAAGVMTLGRTCTAAGCWPCSMVRPVLRVLSDGFLRSATTSSSVDP